MAVFDPELFRKQFPEFKSEDDFPDEMLQMAWDMAAQFISASGCPCQSLSGKQLELALNYMTAHLLVLGKRASSTEGDVTEQDQGGFKTSATVGEISVTTLAPPAKDMWQWWLAQTPYGQALLSLLSMVAVGGMMVGGLPERRAFRKVGGVFF